MYYLRHLKSKLKYSGPLRIIIGGLYKLKITIQLYYIVQEGLAGGKIPAYESGLDGYTLEYLGPQDIDSLCAIPLRITTRAQYVDYFKHGCLCLGLKKEGRLAAFTWSNLKQMSYAVYTRPLKSDEAYLFDAYTLMDYRGKGIAPYLRYQMYKELAKLGRVKLYSISEYLNTSSIKFKQKLNGKIVALYIWIKLFDGWEWHKLIKEYSQKPL